MSKHDIEQLAPVNIGVKNIPIASLLPNPHNPRMLFDRAPLEILKASIEKVGILVPLTVYWNQEKEKNVILDGQRRWMCAKDLGFKEVPVNQIAEPTLVQNIVTMFQIHKLREDWELMPTALKLEVLMNELNETNEKRLASLCGLDQAVVSRCKKLLSYPKKYQDLMLDPDPNKRVKADFFIELYPVRTDRFVNKMKWFSQEKFTRKMLEKYQTRASGLKSVTDFRIMKQYINNARQANKEQTITTKLRQFYENDNLTLDHLKIPAADVSVSARKLLGDLRKIEEAIHQLDVEEYYGEEELWVRLESLLNVIRSKLAAAGRRSKEL
jgi:ParB family chromosome partitioning protein